MTKLTLQIRAYHRPLIAIVITQSDKITAHFVISLDVDRPERILTMVYVYVVQNSQNFSGVFPSSCIPKNTTFRKLDVFPSSGEGGGEDIYSVGPLRES
jgi:hypothetical protein